MNFMLWLLALSGYTITVRCSIQTIVANPGGIGGIYQGPGAETIVHGPDGSIITSQHNGGIIQTESKLDPIIVAEPQILEVGIPIAPPVPVTLAAPLEPVITGTVVPHLSTIPLGHTVDIVEQDPHIIETEIIDAPAIQLKGSTDLVGPSGSISTRGSESIVSGPASTTITRPAKILIAAPVIPAVPVVASVSTPIYAPPLIEVNNELPLTLNRVSTIAPPLNIGSTITPPLNIGSTITPHVYVGAPHLSVGSSVVPHISIGSTVAPPISIGSTVAPPISIGSTVAPPSISSTSVPPLYLGSTIAPPLLRQPVSLLPNNGPRVVPLDGVGIGSIFKQHILLAPAPGGSLSSTDDIDHVGQGLRPIHSYLLGHVHNTPTLLTGEQYGDLRTGQTIPISGQFPAGRPDFIPPIERQPSIISSTPRPSNAVFSSTGVNVYDEGSSGFVQSHPTSISSTLAPPSYNFLPPRGNVQNVPQDWLINRQLVINPAQIPQQNIVPPEIGIPRGAVDLRTTVQTQTTSSPREPNIETSNIQRIGSNEEVERTLQNGYYQNEILVGNTGNEVYNQPHLLRNTNPIQGDVGIPSRGILGTQLSRAGIDSSQIQLTKVPLSDVAGLQNGPDPGRPQEYDDGVAASLWNRYGRKARNRKY